DLFGQSGSVESVTVMRDQMTGRARGFAFVEMSTDEEAQQAITALNGTQVGGRNLTVNEARPKAAGGGGRGGFGGGRRGPRTRRGEGGGAAVAARRPESGAGPHAATGGTTRHRVHGPSRQVADRTGPRFHPARVRPRDLFPPQRPRGRRVVQ